MSRVCRNQKLVWGAVLGIAAMLVVLLTAAFLDRDSKKENQTFTIYLWSASLLQEYAPYIQSQLPDMELNFVVGNNDLDFYQFLKDHGALPDIVTNRRFSLHDTKNLQDQLMDLSETEAAASFYTIYLENYRNNDGTLNWLPVCGGVDGFVANKALFDQYGIPLPTDYESFVAACRAFEEHGIRGFVSDFVYDYTCMEILQGLSIPQLNSLHGKLWRFSYENPTNDSPSLDSSIWPGVFARMEQFIQDVSLRPEDVTLSYSDVRALFVQGKVAMIRETGSAVVNEMPMQGITEPVMLPYFGQNDEDWLLTYPAFQVALNRDLENDPQRKEQALKVLEVIISEQGQSLVAKNREVIPYNKNITLELAPELSNLEPYIVSNYLYIRLASNQFFSISKDVVQKMICGEYNAQQAYEAFDAQLGQSEESADEIIVTFDQGYPYEFRRNGGNPAASAMANTLREGYGVDVLVAASPMFAGPVLQTGYTEQMVGYMMMSNTCKTYLREMTGAEVRTLVQACVEGGVNDFSPFNLGSLPVVSGAFLQVDEQDRHYTLTRILIQGKELEDDAVYRVAYLDMDSSYRSLATQLYPQQGVQAFEEQQVLVRDAWVEFIKQKQTVCAPENYILVT